ncbi:AhpC/TSA family protein [Neorhodopirellula lusitana]|uniref:AhpC/TSA family protein n=1 Tax=Neorhodopirellula lusitana TaxID=445327 RepID=A0ABY1QCV8_9BACT|nr:redoxin domain-containing protein [Neorhodopirellula lusitana]SMP67061.1 AhpC/TSA family protein [Neorhodopirellula lusitana]
MKNTLLTAVCVLAIGFHCGWVAAQDEASETKSKSVKPSKLVAAEPDPDSEASSDDKKPAPAEIVAMTIGSPAPALDIAHWIQDGEGRYPKVTEFEPEKVYVVEFWATWCGPCIRSMPHIVELQESYADRGVQVVSITRENLETVDTFLDREAQPRVAHHTEADAEEASNEKIESETGEEAELYTYRDLTSAYCLTSDPDGSTNRDYMTAARQNGIPCAFIVGKDAKIEWIGHPMRIDEPLEQVVSDTWDREAYKTEFDAAQESTVTLRKLSSLLRKGDYEAAIEAIDEYIADGKSEAAKERFKSIKLNLLFTRISAAEAEAGQYVEQWFNDGTLKGTSLNQVAWTVYEMTKKGRLTNDKPLKIALDACLTEVNESEEKNAYLMDTLAHIQHQLGDLSEAIETQQAAVAAATPDQKTKLGVFLKQLEEEMAESTPDKEAAN